MPVFSDGQKINAALAWDRMIQSVPASYVVWKDGSTYRAECLLKDGADYSGTDAATVIQSAIDAGGDYTSIMFKSGTYTLSSPLIIKKHGISLCGIGFHQVTIEGAALSNYAIISGEDATTWYYFTLRNLRITGGVKIINVPFTRIKNCRFKDSGTDRYNLYIIEGCHYSLISDCLFQNGDAGGIFIEGDNNPLVIKNNAFDTTPNFMLKWVPKTGGGKPQFGVISSNKFESNENLEGAAIVIQSCQYMVISDNVISGYFGDFNVIELAGKDADRSVYTEIIGNNIEIETGNKILCLEDARDCIIIGNAFRDKYGNGTAISLENTAQRNIITNNRIEGTVSVADGATPNIIRYNYGFVTENSGTATISSSTYVDVTHGLAGTPTAINVTPATSGTGDWYISDIGDTTFRINVANSGTYTFHWTAEYKP